MDLDLTFDRRRMFFASVSILIILAVFASVSLVDVFSVDEPFDNTKPTDNVSGD